MNVLILQGSLRNFEEYAPKTPPCQKHNASQARVFNGPYAFEPIGILGGYVCRDIELFFVLFNTLTETTEFWLL